MIKEGKSRGGKSRKKQKLERDKMEGIEESVTGLSSIQLSDTLHIKVPNVPSLI